MWSGAVYLLLGLGWMASAVAGGSGTPDWFRWLLAVGFLVLATYSLFVGYKARRMIRIHREFRQPGNGRRAELARQEATDLPAAASGR
jgi:membrane protein implicated in regulation of membrane protease activity